MGDGFDVWSVDIAFTILVASVIGSALVAIVLAVRDYKRKVREQENSGASRHSSTKPPEDCGTGDVDN
jgi:mannose/fructose/N-acetylgalactosamine-specific phosphotransferase system component IIC